MKQSHHLRLATLLILLILCIRCTKSTAPSEKQAGHFSHFQVPDGFQIELAAGPDLLDYPMFATLDETGRLFVFESVGNVYPNSQAALDTPRFRIKLLVDEDEDGTYDRVTIFADSLSFPQGGVFYRGSLYASSAPDLLKLTDTDNDGIADEKEVILSGWILNVNANSLIGPFMGPDGWLYLTSAIMGFDVTTQEGERLKGETARIWRVRPDGSGLEWISAGGMNNPVELTFGPSGEVLGTQTFFVYPQRGLRDALTYWVEGGVYGKQTQSIGRDQLPLTGELMPVVTQYSRVAPCGLGLYRQSALGEEFRNNLFSTQFNTHAVIRHQLTRSGGSFRTEDTPFFWSENEDVHPTDVLEDGDGSLLVVETGGWFIKGCPLSQVSKPQLKGSIYRIRREGAKRPGDPFGNKIAWQTLAIDELIDFLPDDRPFVTDRAIEQLVDRGQESVTTLAGQLENSQEEDLRIRCVFALYRIGTPEALAAIRNGLHDANENVRVAAARSLGLAGDQSSVDALIAELAKDSEAGRRQAATALGQIREVQAIPHLLAAARNEEDRFVIHALIHSLISLNQPQPILAALDEADQKVKEVALISLDQMHTPLLSFRHLVPFLESQDQSLQHTGLWVASHHPEWSAELIAYLRPKLALENPDEETRAVLELILVSSCGNSDMQQFIAREFDRGGRSQKLFMLHIMSLCRADPFPDIWTKSMQLEWASTQDGEIKSKLMDLVRYRRLDSFDDRLSREQENPSNAPALRVKAITTLLESNPAITPGQFDYLFDELSSSKDIQLRQQVASALGSAKLEETQLLKMTRAYLPDADHFILPRLFPLFQQSQNPEIAKAFIQVLSGSSGLHHFTEDQIRELFVNYPEEINGELENLISKINEARSDRLQRLTQIEAGMDAGDEARGRSLYFGKATCWTCHSMVDEGGDLGPDLTSIQKDRSTHDILEAILYPSVSFVRDYETYEISTATAKYTGIIKEQGPEFIVLGIAPETTVRIKRDDIAKMELSEISLMPQGLGEMLTDEELADLVSFLLGADLVY